MIDYLKFQLNYYNFDKILINLEMFFELNYHYYYLSFYSGYFNFYEKFIYLEMFLEINYHYYY